MSIAIITDSTCDLNPSAQARYHIDIVPLLVTFGDKAFRDGVDISKKEFFARLSKASILPSTSQPSPAAFQEVFRRRLDEGSDIVGIFISAALSGTYQSAVIARGLFDAEEQKRIHLVDSRNGTGSMAVLILEACRLRDQGAAAADVAAQLEGIVPRIRLYAVLDTLKYLKMGGRISGAAAAAGGILNIVPVLTVANGSITVASKIRRNPNAFRKWLRERVSGELPDPRYTAVFLHANNPSLTESIREEFKYLLPKEKSINLCLGAVIGAHIGQDAYGIVYVAKEK
ncbi:MAG: DegV family protein [Clostridiales bacterium]|nr:DegV family protein [Clostridiales bacterium]